MTKVIKEKFKKIKDVKVEDVLLTCDTQLEVFNNEVNRLNRIDDDLFTYEVEVANIPYDSKMDNDLEHEADDDIGYDPSDVAFTEWITSGTRLWKIVNLEMRLYKQKRRRNIYTNYNDAYEINHEDNEREELCEVHKLPVCNVRRYKMIKYSFNNDEEYVAVKEDEYDDLMITREEACQAYQEIFRIMDEGWMVTRVE
ncbi:hypothetical protein Tco_0694874 [Tanacetum coccineum]